MQHGLTGTYTSTIADGVTCQAFVPLPLPPTPALDLSGKLQSRLDEALIALGRLDAILCRSAKRLHATGMAKKAVIGAIMHKLAYLIYGVIHTDRPFDAHYLAKGLVIQDGI